ncbi:hypothetical protein ACIQ6Y_32355 [Streptomyces sp. NPDC096205]|uniref:hypothetical protein n=1 Tax=Streptomyces sp. NPDC096205 TaxID=3366081 RepID=UPI003805B83F
MILDAEQDRMRVWQYAERFLGVGTRSYSAFSEHLDIDDAYHPQSGHTCFTVPTFWVPDSLGQFFRNGVTTDLCDLYQKGDRFLLPVHPEALTCHSLPGRDLLRTVERGPDAVVVPSANARTVFVERLGDEAVPAHFVKLHYPKRLSRFTRRLRRPTLLLHLWVTDELMNAGLPVLPEVAAGVLGDDPDHAWGFLIRETVARTGTAVGDDNSSSRRAGIGACPPDYTVPLFALYGTDFKRPNDPTLLEQLVTRGTEEPAQWIRRRVIDPMVQLWLKAAKSTGCTLELHGQNTLFSFDADARRSAVLYRDCAIYVDPHVRRELGLSRTLPPANVLCRDILMPRENVYSLTYDSFMGHHALHRLAEVAQERLGVAPYLLQQAAVESFARHGGTAVPLPASVFYYDNQLHPASQWRLVDTGRPPVWRPSPA